jgi:hypothetical protein
MEEGIKNNSDSWVKKIFFLLLPAPTLIPLLYLQGKAFYESHLDAFKIDSGAYPLSFDEALLQGFIFYGSSWHYLFLMGASLFVMFPAMNYLTEKINSKAEALRNRKKNKDPHKKSTAWIDDLIIKNKMEFIFSGILVFIAAAILIIVIAVLLAASAGDSSGNSSKKKYEKFFEKLAKSPQEERLKLSQSMSQLKLKGKSEAHIDGFVVAQSDSLISFISAEKVATYNLSDIKEITHIKFTQK